MKKKDIIWKIAYLVMSFGVFMIDQTTKAWAVKNLRPPFGADKEVISNLVATLQLIIDY